jgi:hypothetical protein
MTNDTETIEEITNYNIKIAINSSDSQISDRFEAAMIMVEKQLFQQYIKYDFMNGANKGYHIICDDPDTIKSIIIQHLDNFKVSDSVTTEVKDFPFPNHKYQDNDVLEFSWTWRREPLPIVNDFEKKRYVDLDLLSNADTNGAIRYNAILPQISYYLFYNNLGQEAGRETLISNTKLEPSDTLTVLRTRYWFILESKADEVEKEIYKLIDNFNLRDIVRLRIGDLTFPTKTDFKQDLIALESLEWIFNK